MTCSTSEHFKHFKLSDCCKNQEKQKSRRDKFRFGSENKSDLVPRPNPIC